VIVSIDTEEDNWEPTRDGVTVECIRELPHQHRFLEQFGARTTYFVNHAVSSTPWAADILRSLEADGTVELGGHLHPWNTPPLHEPMLPRYSMLKNLPAAAQHAKLAEVTRTHTEVFGCAPRAFRAGRWGLGTDGVRSLISLGYRIDSSVTPFMDWSAYDDGPDFTAAPMSHYRLDGNGLPTQPVPGGPLLEIPGTFGYSRGPFERWHPVHQQLNRRWARVARLAAFANRSRLLSKIALTPEMDSASAMLRLCRRHLEFGGRYLHVFWHTPTLRPGLAPFVQTRRDLTRFYAAIARLFDGLAAFATPQFVTISEAADLLEAGAALP
jgi:hypothetical protein